MKILIVGQLANPRVSQAMIEASRYLDSVGVEYLELDVSVLPDASFVYSGSEPADLDPQLAGPFDFAVALGGDGTLIHLSRLSTMYNIPVLGVNFGHLGFLAASSEGGIAAALKAALTGDVAVVKRSNLRVDVFMESPDGTENSRDLILAKSNLNVRSFYAFNEVAVARGALGHIVDYDLTIDSDLVASMRGDGLIVSSATGSTAYALSAGGPLVAPHFRGMIVVPIAPHTLNSRAIITEMSDVVEIDLPMRSEQRAAVSLFIDGDPVEFERPIERVVVRVGDVRTLLMKYRMDSFYKQINRTFFSV